MSFDIYGNNLRSGHCEVHPHVHESYPCSACMQESRSRSNPYEEQRSAMDAIQHDVDLMREEIHELRRWRDAAQRVGEALAIDGPDRYYSMPADEWLNWALAVIEKYQKTDKWPVQLP